MIHCCRKMPVVIPSLKIQHSKLCQVVYVYVILTAYSLIVTTYTYTIHIFMRITLPQCDKER